MATDKPLVPFGEYRALTKRKLTEETCKKFGYFIGSFKGELVQIAPYYDKEGKLCGQKLRFANKDFRTTGDFRKAVLFGCHYLLSRGVLICTENWYRILVFTRWLSL
ncbi:hypothetical protein [Klebsiella quasipneumoniae]|uniref:hypothetical protein n=1 Tax=Klebsiella quasipneumoniae TaxID=1463165 RepID=UPI0029DBFBAF|nr:hypothetical protein [Cronobacter malonaticus]HCM7852090.1 hypothetical protein [Klebsiella pneumoniae]